MVGMRLPRVGGLCLASVLAIATVWPDASARADEPPPRIARAPVPLDGVAAIVDDVTIFRSDIVSRLRHFEGKLSRDPRERRVQLAELSKEILTRIINETLVMKDAARLDIEVTDAEVSAGIATVAAQDNMDRKKLEKEVAKAGYTTLEYQEEIRRQILEQKWLVQRAVGKIDRKKAGDTAGFLAAFEKQKELMLSELRGRAYIEVR